MLALTPINKLSAPLKKNENAVLQQAKSFSRQKAEHRVFLERNRQMLRDYDEDFLVRMAYNSNALEGSTLTLKETEIVYEGEFVPDQPGRYQIAARGIFEGWAFIQQALAVQTPLSLNFLQDLHEKVALDLQPRARGTFRSAPAIIRASHTTPADPLKIREALADLLAQYVALLADGAALDEDGKDEGAGAGASQGAPALTASTLRAIAFFHAAFEQIHPFADANGRTGRLLMNYQLMLGAFSPVNIKAKKGLAYKSSLEEWQVHDKPADFYALFLGALAEETKKRSEFFFSGALPGGAQVSGGRKKRHEDVFQLLAENPQFSAKKLSEKLGTSPRQMQRILKELKDEGAIKREGSNKKGQWITLN